MAFAIESDEEEDGRGIAEIPQLPGVLAYGQTRENAIQRVEPLSLRVVADRLENGEGLAGGCNRIPGAIGFQPPGLHPARKTCHPGFLKGTLDGPDEF